MLFPVFTSQPVPWRWGAALVITTLGIRYLPWRVGSTLHLDTFQSAALSVLVLVAEFLLLGHSLLMVWLSGLGGSDGRQEIEAAAAQLDAHRLHAPERLPSVAVLVPTCGEPMEVVRRCLRGIRALDYPKVAVWLLDDADRSELSDLCTRMGIGYLARRDRRHAKAGNLNHALRHVQADLIAVFDADVVPLSLFLRRTVGLFLDPSVGFVQTPQTYMGADPLMRNLRLERWLMADEEAFYRWVEPSRQRLGAVVCAGTSFVVRRAALETVGGFDTGTTSEDLATGIRLVAAGYRGLYVGEKLSAGMAPLTIGAMATQRCRWASGTLQVLRTGANPLTISGLKPLQRLAYLEGILHWLLVYPFLLLVAAPLLIAQVNLAPLRLDAYGLVAIALPFYLSQMLLIRWLSHQSRSALMPELYRWLLAFPLAQTIWAVIWGQPTEFRVTPKGGGIARGVGANLSLLRPLLVFLGIQLLAVFHLILALGPSIRSSDSLFAPSLTLGGVGLMWALLNTVMILAAIRSCWDRPREDAIPWLVPQLEGSLEGRPVKVLAISERGCEVLLSPSIPSDGADLSVLQSMAGGELRLDHPLLAGETWPVRLVCLSRQGLWGAGLEWDGLPDERQDRLENYLYRRPGLWPTTRAPLDLLALAMVGRRLLQRIGPEGWFARSLLPIR
ncbi:MAG: glycosyltransferase [Cyanobium sp.]